MQNHGRDAEYRPPLPPRSPRPSMAASSSGDHRFTSFPPPPGTPPPRNHGSAPVYTDGPPPTLPPRPAGLGNAAIYGQKLAGRSASSSGLSPHWNAENPALLSFPPPPPSPNRPHSSHGRPHSSHGSKPPPLPPRPAAKPVELGATPPSTVSGTSASSPLLPSAQSPLNLTSFPPPPPGPPPQIPSPSQSPALGTVPANPGFSPHPPNSSSSPNPSRLDSNSNVQPGNDSTVSLQTSLPDSPPSALQPQTSPAPTPPVAIKSTPPDGETPVSNPQSPNELSFFPMSPLKTPSCPDEHIEELLEQMMGPAIELTDADTVPLPDSNDDALMVRPLSRQSFNGHSSEPVPSSTAIAPLKPPKTPLNSTRPASVSLSSAGDLRTPSSSGSEAANRKDQDNETSAAESSNQAEDHPTSDLFKTAPSSPAAGTSATTTSAPHELYASEYYYPFPSQAHGVSPDQDNRSGDTDASSSSAASRPVPTCIDAPVTFNTTWYSHFAAPEFFICSRCYADHIESSQFRDAFHVSAPAGGKPRVCRFSSPRMKDDLWKKAVASDYLQPVTDWMQLRSRVLECRGTAGAKASEGAKWYAPKRDAYPSWFAACQACYEDRIKVFPKLSDYFEPHPETPPPNTTWYCDFYVPFVQKEYEKQGPTGDWTTFVREARARSEIPACPGQESTYAYGKAWFRPVHGPDWLLICSACYCDRVFHTTDANKWAPDEQLSKTPEQQVRCPMAQFNISMAMSRAHDLKDYSVFWAAMNKLSQEKFCGAQGITDGVWYTLHGVGPDAGYQVCSSCYVSVAEPLGLSQFFRRKINIPPGATLPCCMNPAHPRAHDFVRLLLEAYYTQSPAALAAYADVYTAIPPCLRACDVKGRRWYGWDGCTICPECHHDFARKYEGLAGLMPLKDALIEDKSTMCEMYSPRMRDLYLLCNGTAQAAPDPKPLLEFAERRRQVFAETFVRFRMMSPAARFGMDRQEVDALEQRWRSVE